MKRLVLGSTMLLTLSSGCVAAHSEERALADPDESAQHVSFVRNGLRFTPLRANHPEQFVERQPTQIAAPSAIDWSSLSDEEWADATTALTLYRGWIYRMRAEPERVQRARRKLAERARDREAQLRAAHAPDADSAVAAKVAPLIIREGDDRDDDRQLQRDNTAYPWRTIAQLESGAGVCTGVIIGTTTGLTAAHCLYDGQNYRENFAWRPGADGWDEEPFPFDEHACYLPFVPEGSGSVQTIDRDYGVADFTEGDCAPRTRPGYDGGTMEPFIFGDAELLGETFHLFGYPGTEVSPQPLELWGHAGSITDALPDVIKFNIDELGGQSGAPVFYWNGWGTALIAGLTSGGTNDFGRTINQGARITPSVLAFIEVFSAEF